MYHVIGYVGDVALRVDGDTRPGELKHLNIAGIQDRHYTALIQVAQQLLGTGRQICVLAYLGVDLYLWTLFRKLILVTNGARPVRGPA
jgi:hypothetical protein